MKPFLGIRKTYIREPADQTTCFQRPWQFCALLFSNKLLQYFASPIYLSNSQPPICLQYVSIMTKLLHAVLASNVGMQLKPNNF